MQQPASALSDLALFEALPDPAAVFAADGVLLASNAAFRAIFRHPISPQRPPWGRIKPPAFRKGLRVFEAAAPDGRRLEWREQILPNGARLALARDVTHRVKAAEAAARAKTVFFATLAHELRTPLNGIIGMSDLLAQTELDLAQQNYVDALQKSGAHLLDLISDVMDYARLEAGMIALEQAPFDPEALAQSVVELLSPRAHAKQLELAVMAIDPLPIVVGDERRVQQILFNLLSNAIKFTETGGAWIEIAAIAPPRTGRVRVRFTVADTGPGIPESKRGLIFQAFTHAELRHARRGEGAGLGLVIVQRLAETMGGAVTLHDGPHGGSVFSVELPFAAPADAPASERESLVGVRVALGAMSAIQRNALSHALRQASANITSIETADILIQNGQHPVPKTMKAIALVAQEERSKLQELLEQNYQRYILTPFRRSALLQQIRDLVFADKPSASMVDEKRFSQKTVLLAEDNAINALLAKTLLERLGFVVTVAPTGEAAVSAAKTTIFDYIILDLRMPDRDGLSAARIIRALPPPHNAAPIIACSAEDGAEEQRAALEAGMDAFLAKPLNVHQLAATLARCSSKR